MHERENLYVFQFENIDLLIVSTVITSSLSSFVTGVLCDVVIFLTIMVEKKRK